MGAGKNDFAGRYGPWALIAGGSEGIGRSFALQRAARGGIILMSSMSALAGGGYVATYAATKAFDKVLSEGLWWELGAFGVDVLGLLAGATATPAMARSTVRYDRAGTPAGDTAMQKLSIVPMDPDDVAREALEHLGQGPIWIAGEKNRATAERLAKTPREEVVRLMSEASAKLHGLALPVRREG